MIKGKVLKVGFIDESTKRAYEDLKGSILYNRINKVITHLLKNPKAGSQIKKRQIPKIYRQKYGIHNLWEYDLSRSWRLIYTIIGQELAIVSVIIEWMDHKEYDRRFLRRR